MKSRLAVTVCGIGITLLFATSAVAGIMNPVDQVTIVDATGKLVGHADDAREPDTARPLEGLELYFEIDGHMVALDVNRKGFLSPDTLLYTEENCGGVAYLDAPDDRWFADRVAVSTPGQTLYRAKTGAPTVTRQLLSRRLGNGTCERLSHIAPVVEAEFWLDLLEEWDLPLKMIPGCDKGCAPVILNTNPGKSSLE